MSSNAGRGEWGELLLSERLASIDRFTTAFNLSAQQRCVQRWHCYVEVHSLLVFPSHFVVVRLLFPPFKYIKYIRDLQNMFCFLKIYASCLETKNRWLVGRTSNSLRLVSFLDSISSFPSRPVIGLQKPSYYAESYSGFSLFSLSFVPKLN